MTPNADSGRVIEWTDDPDFQDWLNELMENASECCWDQDEAMTWIATQYVRHLEAEVKRLGGSLHRDWCSVEDASPNDSSGAS